VEVATAGSVLVRDTTDRDGCTLSVSVGAWAKFTSTIKYRRPDKTRPVTVRAVAGFVSVDRPGLLTLGR
jgi:hypothetical protein